MALGLIPVPYETGAGRAGGRHDRDARRLRRRPAREPGRLRPGRALAATRLAHGLPQAVPGTSELLHRGAGAHSGWCGAIRLFATAAKNAGKDLNRRTFVEAMSKITNFPGTLLPRVELRAVQVLRADPVPGGQAPQQRAAVVPVQAEDEPQAAGHVLGDGAALQAAAGAAERRPWAARPGAGSPPASRGVRPRASTRPAHLLTTLAVDRKSGRLGQWSKLPARRRGRRTRLGTGGTARRPVQTAWYRSAASWRRQRGSYLVLVLLIGLAGGVALGSSPLRAEDRIVVLDVPGRHEPLGPHDRASGRRSGPPPAHLAQRLTDAVRKLPAGDAGRELRGARARRS